MDSCTPESKNELTPHERTAEAYLDTIEARDWASMAQFLTQDSIYEDSTMTYFEGSEAVELRGTEAIVGFWRESSEGTDAAVDNIVVTRFTAGPWVTLVLRPRVDIDGAFWDVPGTRIVGRFDQVTVLEIVDGKVLRHVDYVDYGEAMSHVDAARASSG